MLCFIWKNFLRHEMLYKYKISPSGVLKDEYPHQEY